jgi:hypothetical protein
MSRSTWWARASIRAAREGGGAAVTGSDARGFSAGARPPERHRVPYRGPGHAEALPFPVAKSLTPDAARVEGDRHLGRLRVAWR